MVLKHNIYSAPPEEFVFLSFIHFVLLFDTSHDELTDYFSVDLCTALRKTFKMSRTKTFVAAHKAAPFSSKSILSWVVSAPLLMNEPMNP